MPKMYLESAVLDAILIVQSDPGGKEGKPPCWQDAGLFYLQRLTPAGAERPPTPWEIGGESKPLKA